MIQAVYKMLPSCEIDRPEIDDTSYFGKWDDLDRPFPPGVDTLKCEKLLTFYADAPDALNWDWYGRNGPWGMWSQRAKDLLWPYAQKHLRCFQTTLNGAPYYILRLDRELALNCLDHEKSDVEYFDDSRARANIIKKYGFKPGFIKGPLIFHVPERPDILATNSIRQMIEEAGLKGFEFFDAADLYGYYGKTRPS